MAEVKYTDRQRDAVGYSAAVLAVRPYQRIVELAAAGELSGPDGHPVSAFELNVNSARDLKRSWLKRNPDGWERPAGALEDVPPRDAIEAMRRETIAMIEESISAEKLKSPAERDPERLRRLARAVADAARIPGPREPVSASPDSRDPVTGERAGGRSVGRLLEAFRDTQPSPPVTAPPEPLPLIAEGDAAPVSSEPPALDPREEVEAWMRAEVEGIETADPNDVERWQPVGVPRLAESSGVSLEEISARMRRECGPWAAISNPYRDQRRPDGSIP